MIGNCQHKLTLKIENGGCFFETITKEKVQIIAATNKSKEIKRSGKSIDTEKILDQHVKKAQVTNRKFDEGFYPGLIRTWRQIVKNFMYVARQSDKVI